MLSQRSHFLQAFPIDFLPDGGPSQAALCQQKRGKGGQIEWQQNREAKGDEGKGKRRGGLEKNKGKEICVFHTGIM